MGRIIVPGQRGTEQSAVQFIGDKRKEAATQICYFFISSAIVRLDADIKEKTQKKTNERKLKAFWEVAGGLRAMLDPKWLRTFDNAVERVLRDVHNAAQEEKKRAREQRKEAKPGS